MTLSRKIALTALVNLVLLAAVTVVFFRWQFAGGTQSLLFAPVHDRILAIANRFSVELGAAPEAVDSIFAAYRQRYQADFYLTRPDGEVLAGPDVIPPDEVLRRMRPPPGRRPPPPPPPPPLWSGADWPGGPPRPPPGRPPRRPPPVEPGFLVVTHNPIAYWAGARIPATLPDFPPGVPAVLLIRSGTIFNSRIFLDLRLWAGTVLGMIVLSMLCWLPLIRGLTRTIRQMDLVTAQMAEGRFDTQVVVDRRDELGSLGAQINRLAARLDSFVNNQKRFLGDISHELCAPIARVQFALGILEQKCTADQLPNLAILYEEVQEMTTLVNELLSFSKAGLSTRAIPLTAVDVGAAVDRAVAREAFFGATVETEIPRGLVVTASESLLVRALSNVLRNAVRYAGPSGPITVSARRSDASVEIRIADSGPGLPESELEQVFAPFYRPEASRTRATGGAGLGLAIVKTCVEACGGTVVARNRRPKGLEILVTIPEAKYGVAHASANPVDAVPPTVSSNIRPPDSARSQS